MPYRITLTEEDCRAIDFAGGRYGWSLAFPAPAEPGTHEIAEHDLWEWCEAVEEDMQGGHAPFPLLDPDSDTYRKFYRLYDSRI